MHLRPYFICEVCTFTIQGEKKQANSLLNDEKQIRTLRGACTANPEQ